MQRPRFAPGNYYHVLNRGAHRESIFREEDNYLFVLRKMKRYTAQLDLTLIAYCLMPNHGKTLRVFLTNRPRLQRGLFATIFLVRQNGDHSAGLLPQRVFSSYTKAYNKRYEHSGTLFEGPYKAREIRQDNHLLHLCRCIHANPVKHGLAGRPEEWPYSSYLEWVRMRSGELVDRAFVATHFPSSASYGDFLHDYLIQHRLLEGVEKHLRALGCE